MQLSKITCACVSTGNGLIATLLVVLAEVEKGIGAREMRCTPGYGMAKSVGEK